jgi:hypothetical protein
MELNGLVSSRPRCTRSGSSVAAIPIYPEQEAGWVQEKTKFYLTCSIFHELIRGIQFGTKTKKLTLFYFGCNFIIYAS